MKTYDQALKDGAEIGASKAPDDALMALYCESVLQHVVGAVSPRLVYEGAQKSGMSANELTRLCAKDPFAVDGLQWL